LTPLPHDSMYPALKKALARLGLNGSERCSFNSVSTVQLSGSEPTLEIRILS